MPKPSRAPGDGLPRRAGVGLKAEHYRAILEAAPDLGFFEVHAENYMGAGGPPHRCLSAIRNRYPLSLHGVGLCIGADRPLDREHLIRLRLLIDRYRPAAFSEHLAWSSHDAGFLNDLLPLPYTRRTLALVGDHIDEVQETLGVRMLLENASVYLPFAESDHSETDFLREISARTGCGLLLDVSNVIVSSTNLERDPFAYIDAYPLDRMEEIHLAGHAPDADEEGQPLLIDAHDRPVDAAVWDLFAYVVGRAGPLPTLIEWDANVRSWATLKAEADRAESLLAGGADRSCGAGENPAIR